jgi:hypothetical protein
MIAHDGDHYTNKLDIFKRYNDKENIKKHKVK